MFGSLDRLSIFSLTKKTLVVGLIGYSAFTTVLLIRLNPKPLLIGIDSYGTRIIRDGGDRLLRQEKENFLQHFLTLQYSYDSSSFEKRISDCGDLMTEELWSLKKGDFERLSKQLKAEELTQAAEIQEIREIDALEFEVDMLIHIKRRLTQSVVKLRVNLRIRNNSRHESNPYPYEVESYDEIQAS